MRGAFQTLTRLNAVNIGLATAAFLALNAVPVTAAWASPLNSGAGAGSNLSTTPAIATDASALAYAVPRGAPATGEEVVLPQPLPPSAVAQYRRIQALQAQGDTKAADAMIGRLIDPTLVGPILADRYLSPGYVSSVAELTGWLAQYGTQPAAPAIYALLRKKSPESAARLPSPLLVLMPETPLAPAGAAKPSPVPLNGMWRHVFLRGIADWQAGDIAASQPLFLRAAEMPNISADDRAAADFWSARAALRLQRPVEYLNWLTQAAMADNTFYGMLAGRLLGQGFGASSFGSIGIAATLTEADITAVDAIPNGHLAFALLQIGATDQAATALRALWPDIQADAGLAHSVMAVAAHAGLVDVAIAVAGQLPATGDAIADARLPLPALHPDGGFTVDPPLVYALTRTESGFDSHAVSRSGAQGLMQLMPVTASFIARNQRINGARSTPSANLALGQGYIHYLGEQRGINDNLLAILASYNAGPNAASDWYNALQTDSDPLVFIETIPNDETRRFVRQVLTDSWIYAEEIGLPAQSLDAIAEGSFPQLSAYTALAAVH